MSPPLPAMGVIAEAMTAFVRRPGDAREVRRRLARRDAPKLRELRCRARCADTGGRAVAATSDPRRVFRGRGRRRSGGPRPQQLGRPFLDFDAEIERETGMTVQRDLSAERGEEHFRAAGAGVDKGAERDWRHGVVTRGRLDHSTRLQSNFCARLDVSYTLERHPRQSPADCRRVETRPLLAGRDPGGRTHGSYTRKGGPCTRPPISMLDTERLDATTTYSQGSSSLASTPD